MIVSCYVSKDRIAYVKISMLNRGWFLADGGVAAHDCGRLSDES